MAADAKIYNFITLIHYFKLCITQTFTRGVEKNQGFQWNEIALHLVHDFAAYSQSQWVAAVECQHSDGLASSQMPVVTAETEAWCVARSCCKGSVQNGAGNCHSTGFAPGTATERLQK